MLKFALLGYLSTYHSSLIWFLLAFFAIQANKMVLWNCFGGKYYYNLKNLCLKIYLFIMVRYMADLMHCSLHSNSSSNNTILYAWFIMLNISPHLLQTHTAPWFSLSRSHLSEYNTSLWTLPYTLTCRSETPNSKIVIN